MVTLHAARKVPSDVWAVITAEPIAIPRTLPEDETVAIAELLVDHITP